MARSRSSVVDEKILERRGGGSTDISSLFAKPDVIDPQIAVGEAVKSLGENVKHPEIVTELSDEDIERFATLDAVNVKTDSQMIRVFVDRQCRYRISRNRGSRKELTDISKATVANAAEERKGLLNRLGGLFS